MNRNTYVLALRDGTERDLDLSLGQDIGGGGHVDQEIWRERITSVVCSKSPKFPQLFKNIVQLLYSMPSLSDSKIPQKPTLNSSLGTDSGRQTEGAGHEVGKDLVGAGRVVGLVLAEVGDLQGRAGFVSTGEGGFERRLRIGDSPPLLAGGNGGAGDG